VANNIQIAYSYFISKGLSPNAAAGIVGNLKAESNVDPKSNQQGGPGMGIAQWSEGGRWDSLLTWARARDRDPYDLQTQLDFVWHELTGPYSHVLSQLKNTTNMAHATEVFMKEYEIPADQSPAAVQGRVALADDVRDNNREGTGAADGGGGGNGGGGGGDGGGNKSDFGFSPQFLEEHPEIDRLVQEGMNKEWSDTRFQAELKQTNWWQNHTQAQREYQVLLAEDPAEAEAVLKDTEQQIRALATQLGVTLRPGEIEKMAERAAKNAWDSTELQMAVGREFQMGKGAQTGLAATTVQDLRSMADEFVVPISRQRLANWTQDVLQGKQSVEGYADIMRERAKALYPHLADAIDRAGSVRAWADPYLQTASQMLGVSADDIRLDRGKFAQVLQPTGNTEGKADGKAMSLDQWQNLIRNDERFGWDKTNGAQEQAAQMTTELARMMGAM
jgi:hypothetical protein